MPYKLANNSGNPCSAEIFLGKSFLDKVEFLSIRLFVGHCPPLLGICPHKFVIIVVSLATVLWSPAVLTGFGSRGWVMLISDNVTADVLYYIFPFITQVDGRLRRWRLQVRLFTQVESTCSLWKIVQSSSGRRSPKGMLWIRTKSSLCSTPGVMILW